MLVLAEISSRFLWQKSEFDACVVTDPVLGHRYKPHCDSRVKSVEGPWVANHYNACGYRTDAPCGSRPAETLRIDLLGSSTAEGYLVPYESTIGATVSRELGEKCHHDVQTENMSMPLYQGNIIFAQLDEALHLRPDAIVFLVTPLDFDENNPKLAQDKGPVSQPPELLRRMQFWMSQSRAIEVAEHFMFKDSTRYASLYLNYGDRADFLRPPFTRAWRDRLTNFDDLLRRMQAKISPSHIPLVLIYVPSRAQAALLSSKNRPAGVDPFAFGRVIGEIAGAYDIPYVNLSERFSHLPDAADLFYPKDGHLTGQGDPIVGRDIAVRLMAEVPALQQCNQS